MLYLFDVCCSSSLLFYLFLMSRFTPNFSCSLYTLVVTCCLAIHSHRTFFLSYRSLSVYLVLASLFIVPSCISVHCHVVVPSCLDVHSYCTFFWSRCFTLMLPFSRLAFQSHFCCQFLFLVLLFTLVVPCTFFLSRSSLSMYLVW